MDANQDLSVLVPYLKFTPMNILYEIDKKRELIWNKIKEIYGKTTYKERLKKDRLSEDVILGCIVKVKADRIKPNVCVITDEGQGYIKDIKDNWYVISYNGGKRLAEKPKVKVWQYYVKVFNRNMHDSPILYPLLYADYPYIHPDADNGVDDYHEFHITSKKYAKLTEEEKVKYEHMPLFNKLKVGQDILRKLEKNNLSMKIKDGKLLTIKQK